MMIENQISQIGSRIRKFKTVQKQVFDHVKVHDLIFQTNIYASICFDPQIRQDKL